jgi:hypothetical protein
MPTGELILGYQRLEQLESDTEEGQYARVSIIQ